MRTTIMAMMALSLVPNTVAAYLDSGPTAEEYLGLPRGLLEAICRVESGNNPSRVHKNDGRGDSLGLCQIKLSTARLVGFKGTRKQLMNAKVNMYYAGKYLKYQVNRYKGNYAKATTAYNQGTSYSHGGSEYLAKVFTAWASSK